MQGATAVVAAIAAVLAWILWGGNLEPSPPQAPLRLGEARVAQQPPRESSPDGHRSNTYFALEAAGEDLDAMIDSALDSRATLNQRVRAVWWLGRFGSDEAVDVLERVLHSDARAAVKASAAHALGFSGHDAVGQILESLLQSTEITVACGAIRGLAATGDLEFVSVLEALLHDPAARDMVRGQAAVSLADLAGPKAQESLLSAFRNVESEDLAGSVLEGLGKLPFEQTTPFFRGVLEDGQLSDGIKAAALEALGESTPDAVGLLSEVAAGASSPELRIAAVDALAFLEDASARPQTLLKLLASEAEPDVRVELYSTLALDAREVYTRSRAERVVSLVLSETSTDARLEGIRLVAYMLSGTPREPLVEPFEREMVPWLLDQATTSQSRYRRLVAVEALQVAGTRESRGVLAELTRGDDVEVAAAAARGIAPGG
jgi:HEAT repeat protein